jgi:hypothetical protein
MAGLKSQQLSPLVQVTNQRLSSFSESGACGSQGAGLQDGSILDTATAAVVVDGDESQSVSKECSLDSPLGHERPFS